MGNVWRPSSFCLLSLFMSKKDRIAVVLSIPYLLFVLLVVFNGGRPDTGLVIALPLIAYWGYRFIKNDISFLKVRDDTANTK